MGVSAILGADLSIDEEMYVNAMSQINGLFADPMDQKRLNATILTPMTRAQQTGLVALGHVLGRDGQLCGHRLSQ